MAAPGTTVLLYHRVCDAPDDHLGMRVAPEHFSAHLEEIRAVADIVRVDDLDRRPRRRRLGKLRRRVVITFDDGYLDNAEIAAPLLARFEAPATMFVTTGSFGDAQEYWWDRLWHLLVDTPAPATSLKTPSRVTVSIAGTPLQLQLTGPGAGVRAYVACNRRLIGRSPGEISAVATELEAQLGIEARPCAAHRRMQPDDLRHLQSGGLVEVGGHGRSHACLAALGHDEATGEIGGCRNVLAGVLDRAPSAFAYPYGAPGTFGSEHAQLARACGFTHAFANVAGWHRPGDDRFSVPRFVVGNWDRAQFRAQLAGWLAGRA